MRIDPPHYAAYIPELNKGAISNPSYSILTLSYPPSFNELFAHIPSPHGGYIRVKTEKYRRWLKENALPPRTKHKRDLGNIEKAISDVLVECNIIKDDSLIQEINLAWEREWPEIGVRVFITDWRDRQP